MFTSLAKFSDMIKLGHTLFALPFALSALCLAYRCSATITPIQVLYIILAFAGARAFAMAFNRIVDRKIDALNPRTKNRHLPAKQISLQSAIFFTFLSAMIFCISAYMLNMLCFYLSFLALAILAFYSFTKRFSSFAHYFLGFAIAICPIGVSVALFGRIDFAFIPLSLALLFHISGFDLLYSMQDRDFDIKNNLHSIPAMYGNKVAKIMSLTSFMMASLCLIWLGISQNMPIIYFIVISIAIFVYFAEHIIIKLSGLKNIDIVFFQMNVAVSLLILAAMTLSCIF